MGAVPETLSDAVEAAPSPEGYRHEALFYSNPDEFLAGTLAFAEAGIAAEEPTLVVLAADKLARLEEALGPRAAHVEFADMNEVGRNPARIIPRWVDFVASHRKEGRQLRGIGEPISAQRSPAELTECERHEALLNVCFDDPNFWLLCPYDAAALPEPVLDRARRHHHLVSSRGRSVPSEAYPGAATLAAPWKDRLTPPPAGAVLHPFGAEHLSGMRRLVEDVARAAGLSERRREDLVLAVNEVATNSVVHGGGRGVLRIWADGDSMICEVRDQGRILEPLAGRRAPDDQQARGWGLWMANQLCDLVQIRSGLRGGVVRLHLRFD